MAYVPVFTDTARRLYALSATSGATRWVRSVTSPQHAGFGLTVDAGRVFAVTGDGVIHAFSSAGSALWSKSLATASWTLFQLDPVAINGTLYVSAGGYGGVLMAVNEKSGAVRWRRAFDTTPGFAADSGAVYATTGCNLIAIKASGSVRWQHTSRCSGGSGYPVLHGGDVVVTIGTFSRSSGTREAQVHVGFATGSSLAVGWNPSGHDCQIFGMRVATGRRLWTHGSSTTSDYAPPNDCFDLWMVIAGRVVYDLAHSIPRVYAFDLSSGRRLWSDRTDWKSSACSAAGNGFDMPTEAEGRLYAVRCGAIMTWH